MEGHERALFFPALASISLQCLESKVFSSQCEPAVPPQNLVAERMLRQGEKHKDLLVRAVANYIHWLQKWKLLWQKIKSGKRESGKGNGKLAPAGRKEKQWSCLTSILPWTFPPWSWWSHCESSLSDCILFVRSYANSLLGVSAYGGISLAGERCGYMLHADRLLRLMHTSYWVT